MMDLVAFVHRIHQGDLEQELKLEYSTEFVQLSKEMNTMAAGLRDRMRLRNALALAQEVQQNLLPSDMPEINGLDIAGHATYCDETGGDYFDFLRIAGQPDTTAAIAVGDVVGHGLAAAMRKEICWAAAGHNAPIVYDPATDHFSEFNGSGMSLGLVKGVAYEEQLFTDVQSGQVIMAFTDVQTVAA